jgi:hypothetical protein
MNNEVPLVYTSKGNLPASALAYDVRWEETEEYVKCIETYTLADEVVRQSAHVLSRQPTSVGATINPF